MPLEVSVCKRVCLLVTLYQHVILTLWTQALVCGTLIKNGWWTRITWELAACGSVSLHVSICDYSAAVSVVRTVSHSAWRKCRSSLGRVDGRAALQRLQDPMAPVSPVPQTDWEHLGSVSASGPCRLRSIWRERGVHWIRARENMSQIPQPCANLMLCQLACSCCSIVSASK